MTIGLQKGLALDFSTKKMTLMTIAALVIFSLMAIRYAVGNVPGYVSLPADLTISAPVMLTVLIASLVGGWVVSNAFSQHVDNHKKMASLLPVHLPWGWTLFGFFFFPTMILTSCGIALLLGVKLEYPAAWGLRAFDVVPLFLLSFILTALAQGGMEEPGWRGFLQPTLQKRFSPLVAALIVSLFWSLWHLPLYLLVRALQAKSNQECRSLAQEFLQVRNSRRQSAGLSPDLIEFERKREWVEGIGRYAEIGVYRLAHEKSEYSPAKEILDDPVFYHYEKFDQRWTRELDQMKRMAQDESERRFYYSGMAQAVLLDRLAPGWKSRIFEPGIWLDELLEEAVISTP